MLNNTEIDVAPRQTIADISRQISEEIEELIMLSGALNRFVTGEEDVKKEPAPDVRCFNDDLMDKEQRLRTVRANLRSAVDAIGINV